MCTCKTHMPLYSTYMYMYIYIIIYVKPTPLGLSRFQVCTCTCTFSCRNVSSADSASSLSNGNALTLQDLIEKVVLLKKAVERERKQFSASSSETLQSKLQLYASVLASQGSLATALCYLQQAAADNVRANTWKIIIFPYLRTYVYTVCTYFTV